MSFRAVLFPKAQVFLALCTLCMVKSGICEAVGLLWLYSSLGLTSVLWLQQNYKVCFVFGFNLFSLPTYVGCSPLLLWHAGIPHLPLDTGQGQDLGALQGGSRVSFLLILAVRLLIACSLFHVQSLIWEALYRWPWIYLIACWWALSVAMGLGC